MYSNKADFRQYLFICYLVDIALSTHHFSKPCQVSQVKTFDKDSKFEKNVLENHISKIASILFFLFSPQHGISFLLINTIKMCLNTLPRFSHFFLQKFIDLNTIHCKFSWVFENVLFSIKKSRWRNWSLFTGDLLGSWINKTNSQGVQIITPSTVTKKWLKLKIYLNITNDVWKFQFFQFFDLYGHDIPQKNAFFM